MKYVVAPGWCRRHHRGRAGEFDTAHLDGLGIVGEVLPAGPHRMRPPAVQVVSRPLDSNAWSGATGRVYRAAMGDFPDLSGWQTFACGFPEAEFFSDPFTRMADSTAAAIPREFS